MDQKQGEVYAGPTKDDSIEVTVETESGPKTGDKSGEIFVKTVETTTTNTKRRPKMAKPPQTNGAPKKKKAGPIVLAIVLVIALFGCMGGGNDSDNSDSTADTSTDTVTEEETATEEAVEEEEEKEEETATEEAVEEEEEKEEEPVDEYYSWTSEQQHCYNKALDYLDFKGFSKQGLIDQLSSEYGENYPVDVAEFAVNKIEERGEVDWVEQAKRSAQDYLDFSDFSKQGLIDQLSSPYGDQYTVEEATEAVEAVY